MGDLQQPEASEDNSKKNNNNRNTKNTKYIEMQACYPEITQHSVGKIFQAWQLFFNLLQDVQEFKYSLI